MSIFLFWTIPSSSVNKGASPDQRKEATERGNRSHNAKDVDYYFALHPFGRRHKKSKAAASSGHWTFFLIVFFRDVLRLIKIRLDSALVMCQTNFTLIVGSLFPASLFFFCSALVSANNWKSCSLFYESSLSVDGRDKFMNEIGKHQRAMIAVFLVFVFLLSMKMFFESQRMLIRRWRSHNNWDVFNFIFYEISASVSINHRLTALTVFE